MPRHPETSLIVYVDHRPFAWCIDRGEGLRVVRDLLKTHHSKRVHLLRA
ncbi:hypothetical protein [Cyanobium sp. CH-040]|nr:hypothetical protein [Cyanobium sp. CH-040]MCP9928478.1 hypothetical protein [Cyanobium sp. CH-040]